MIVMDEAECVIAWVIWVSITNFNKKTPKNARIIQFSVSLNIYIAKYSWKMIKVF